MKQVWGLAVAAALVAGALPAAPVLAASASSTAKSSCNDRLRRDYDATTRNVKTSESGYARYNVTGEARRNGETANFTCRTDGGSVTSLNVGSWRKGSGGGEAVAAVGIAVGLAAIIAAASSKKKNDQYDRYGQQNYYQNNSASNSGYSAGYDNDSYSPGSGVTCYRVQRACFDSYNNYSPRWTQREFNY